MNFIIILKIQAGKSIGQMWWRNLNIAHYKLNVVTDKKKQKEKGLTLRLWLNCFLHGAVRWKRENERKKLSCNCEFYIL